MKKQTKGLIVAAFFGIIMLTSLAAGALIYQAPPQTSTGTPADNFPYAQRAQFCGTSSAKSNTFVKEYKIPTECTQPLAITTDPQGNVWFAEANTGRIAMFDPATETFTDYENPTWP